MKMEVHAQKSIIREIIEDLAKQKIEAKILENEKVSMAIPVDVLQELGFNNVFDDFGQEFLIKNGVAFFEMLQDHFVSFATQILQCLNLMGKGMER